MDYILRTSRNINIELVYLCMYQARHRGPMVPNLRLSKAVNRILIATIIYYYSNIHLKPGNTEGDVSSSL
jgi:hypothetical protein